MSTLGLSGSALSMAQASSDGGAVFISRCAVCHGPQAGGIPGTFPPLRAQVVAFAKIPQGREYLMTVVMKGLMGELKVGGTAYNGVMPAQSALSDSEVAAVVNFLGSDLGRSDYATPSLKGTDVAAIRARIGDQSAKVTRESRPTLTDQ